MKKIIPVGLVTLVLLGACTRLREPSDAQLTQFLRLDNAAPTDTSARLNGEAIDCLRGWSGDPELLKGLAVRFAGEDGKKACRVRLDQWITENDRNPDAFRFEDFAAPGVVRRAQNLEKERSRSVAAMPPPVAPPQAAPAGIEPIRASASKVELGAAGVDLSEAEGLCRQIQEKGAQPKASERMHRFASFCGSTLNRLRVTVESATRNGMKPEQVDQYTADARKISEAARNALADEAAGIE